jgi:hypothetical protein
MRTAHLFLDLGNGWENLTNHARPNAALDELSIDWGTDHVTDQPDVNVLTFRVLDRDGSLAGKASSLAGCRVMIQLTAEPTWSQTTTSPLTWEETPGTWNELHDHIDPDPDEPPTPRNRTLFTGRVTTGGSLEKTGSSWILHLTASSDMILAKREQKQGPTSTDPKWADHHWTGTLQNRVAEINRRLASAGAPPLASSLLQQFNDWTMPLAPYETDTFPTLLDLIHRIALLSDQMPLIVEDPTTPSITAAKTALPASLVLHSTGSLTVTTAEASAVVIPGNEIEIDNEELTLPDPLSQIVLNGKKAKWESNDGKLTFEDATVTFTSEGALPANLTQSQASATLDIDAVISDESEGHLGQAAWNPTNSPTRINWLKANTLRLRPSALTLTSRRTHVTDHEFCFTPTPFLIGMVHNRYTSLLGDDGKPATSGAWMAIGGTLTFTNSTTPEFRNELNLQPLHLNPTTLATWGALTPITLPWSRLSMTWAELGTITEFAE